jgi:hypothetical protein
MYFCTLLDICYDTVMVTKPTQSRVVVANTFGTLGYISIIFQWLWSIIILAQPILSSDMGLLIPQHEPSIAQTPAGPPSTFAVFIVVFLTILIFAFTLYVLWKLPATVGKKAGEATKHAAETLVPLVTPHHKPTAKQRRIISHRLTLGIKWALILIPLIALAFSHPIDGLSISVIWIIGLFCAICSSLYLGLQQLLGKLWRIPPERIW